MHYYFYNKENNFGDMLNPFLLNLLKIDTTKNVDIGYKGDICLLIGSILHHFENTTGGTISVWGTGAMHTNFILNRNLNIHAVRGEYTKKILELNGYAVPTVFGDPALLLSRLYSPPHQSLSNEIIIIPHMSDKKNPILGQFKKQDNVEVLDVFSDVKDLICKIANAKVVLSSSLHGLIVAIAYSIPCIWINLWGPIKGGWFKFYDFFSSIGIEEKPVTLFSDDIKLKDLVYKANTYNIDSNIRQLMSSCPFI